MDLYSVPIKEAVISINTEQKKEERHLLYWFQKDDGSVFSANEKEAWEILNGRIRIMNEKVKHKYLGVSNGEVYWEGIKKLPEITKTEGIEKGAEYIRELNRLECQSADPNRRPRNMDRMGFNGQVANIDLSSIRL